MSNNVTFNTNNPIYNGEITLTRTSPTQNGQSEIYLKTIEQTTDGKTIEHTHGHLDCATYRDESVHVDRIDNFTTIPGIGFYLMTQAIKLYPSCQVKLTSVKAAVFFYWKLGFRVEQKYYRGKGDNEFLAEEIRKAKEENRKPKAPDGPPMYLPYFARRQWQHFLPCDELLQSYLNYRQQPIYIIAQYLDLGGRNYQLPRSYPEPQKAGHPIFCARDGQDMALDYSQATDNNHSLIGRIHALTDPNLHFGSISILRSSNEFQIQKLTNSTKEKPHKTTIQGICFYLLKKQIEVQSPAHVTFSVDRSEHLFFYYKCGFRLNPKTQDNYSSIIKKINLFLGIFRKAQKEDINLPGLFFTVNLSWSSFKLNLPESSIQQWKEILASDPPLQEGLLHHQRPIQVVQEYLLPPIEVS